MENRPITIDESAVREQSGKRSEAGSVPLGSYHSARLSRVLDYQIKSLEKDDPLEANLGSINSGLIRMALWLDETIEQAMESGPPNVERLSKVLPAIDTHLRVTRQVDRFANIELRAAEARKPKPAEHNGKKKCLDSPAGGGVEESEDSEV